MKTFHTTHDRTNDYRFYSFDPHILRLKILSDCVCKFFTKNTFLQIHLRAIKLKKPVSIEFLIITTKKSQETFINYMSQTIVCIVKLAMSC